MLKRRYGIILSLILLSGSAFGLTLDQARQQGRAGETLNGYLAARTQDAETLALVKRINAARAENYQQLASRNNLSPDDVAKLAGQKLVDRAASGEYVRGINGLWMRKP